jgi:butyryl-CoA dehydrogenase
MQYTWTKENVMKSFTGKVAVITGAGSGMGRHMAISLAKDGAIVALQDINKKTLTETAAQIRNIGGKYSEYPFDISDRKKIKSLPKEIIKIHGHVDIIINNAGVSFLGEIIDMTYEDFEWIANINLWAPIAMCKEFLPYLLTRPEASIVNVSSIFGIIANPFTSAYCIAKAGLRGFTESLRQELTGSNVAVTLVCPGGIKTNIGSNPRHSGKLSKQQLDYISKIFYKNCKTTAEKAANIILKAVRKKKPRVLVGFDAKLINLIGFLIPGKYDRLMLKESADSFKIVPNAYQKYMR